jgi:hypothetical protein
MREITPTPEFVEAKRLWGLLQDADASDVAPQSDGYETAKMLWRQRYDEYIAARDALVKRPIRSLNDLAELAEMWRWDSEERFDARFNPDCAVEQAIYAGVQALSAGGPLPV